jgi:hypothetical protein
VCIFLSVWYVFFFDSCSVDVRIYTSRVNVYTDRTYVQRARTYEAVWRIYTCMHMYV